MMNTLNNPDVKGVVELFTLAFLILGSTWRLSAQISSIAAKLEAHIVSDRDKFAEVDTTLNTIAPRGVRLDRRTR